MKNIAQNNWFDQQNNCYARPTCGACTNCSSRPARAFYILKHFFSRSCLDDNSKCLHLMLQRTRTTYFQIMYRSAFARLVPMALMGRYCLVFRRTLQHNLEIITERRNYIHAFTITCKALSLFEVFPHNGIIFVSDYARYYPVESSFILAPL